MKTSLILIILFFLSVGAFAQGRVSAIKIDEVDEKGGGPEIVIERAKLFIKALSASEKETRGFVTIAEKSDLARKIKGLLVNLPEHERTVVFFTSYLRPSEPKLIEFWLVPKGAEFPYDLGCGGCICPSISVFGPDKYTLDQPIRFTAKVEGGDEEDILEYVWKVDGGEIEKGQGSLEIEVRPLMSDPKDITATLEVKGTRPGCSCPTIAFSTSRLRP